MNSYQLEICVDSVDSALIAAQSGATRLELCSNLIIGGTTPPNSLMSLARSLVTLPIHVLIRPRFGDFLYSPLELEQMKQDVIHAKTHMMDGIVIGALTADGKLDSVMLGQLIQLANGMHLTLSRAFDLCSDPFEALETAIELGIHTILTSGQASTCLEGRELLKALIEAARGRIQIMPGAGLTADAIGDLHTYTGATSFHFSAKVLRDSLMIYKNPAVSMGLPGIAEDVIFGIQETAIRQARHTLDTL